VTLRVVRLVVAVVCVAGIGGMVAGSIADNNGAAVTSGLVAAVAIVVLMAFTLATRAAESGSRARPVDELRAERVEHQLQALVSRGTDEQALRSLVADAVRLGRGE